MQKIREKPDFFETRQGFFGEKSQGVFEKSQDGLYDLQKNTKQI